MILMATFNLASWTRDFASWDTTISPECYDASSFYLSSEA
jgi:hypothetical protein